MEKKANKKLFWSTLIVIVVVAVVLRLGSLYNDKKKEVNSDKAEVMALKQANSSAVALAASYKAQKIRKIDQSDIYIGSLEAPVQVIVYEDYSNKINASYRDNIEKLAEEFPTEVVIAFRPYYVDKRGIVPEISQALWCANDQEGYFQLRDEVYKKVEQDSFLLPVINDLVLDLKLNEEEFKDCLEGYKYRDKLEALNLESKSFGVSGAPTTFINDSLIIGARRWEDVVDSNNELTEGLQTIVNKYLAK